MTRLLRQIVRTAFAGRCGGAISAIALLGLILAPYAYPQLTTGSLSGTVRDATGAVVPGAHVTLLNQATNDARTTLSNSTGYFTFAAVQPGSYAITVSAPGFSTWKGMGILMNAGDTRTVPDIRLKVGSEAVSISVTSSPAQMVPTDSGERSQVITSKDLNRLSLESRNVSELLKILPGVTQVPNGTQGGSSVDFSAEAPMGSTVGVGYSPSGAPYRGGSSYFLDGANIIDPGCNCWSIAVPNPDMTSEVKVQNTFGADSPNGPQVINVTSKSGSNQFHGQVYFYARNQALNSNTWLNNNSGTAKQPGQYYYPGGNIGGPVLIPGTNFNHNRKLLFWTGYEYYKQTLPAGQPFESYIPSAGMMTGNFTASGAGNSALCPNGFTSTATNWCNDLSNSYDANGNPLNPAAVPVDPGATALMKMFPKANADPTKTPGGYNYVQTYGNQQNGYVWRVRGDYNLSDNMKLFATYQQGNTTFITPGHVWWNPGFNIPYPGGNIDQPTTSRVLTANVVNVITPTLTNEFVFGWGFGNEPFSPTNLQAIYKSTLQYPYSTVYNNASKVAPSISANYAAQTFPDISQPAFYGPNGQYVTKKAIPSFADNVTKVWRNHTFKAGVFTELVGNDQGAWSYPNGNLSFGSQPMPNGVTGSTVAQGQKIGSSNPTANLVMGIASSFSQNNFAPVQDLAYRTTSVYVMDDWKFTPRLSLNLGVRWDHIGRWYDRQGLGMAVWLPQLFTQDVATNEAAKSMVVEYPGVRWRGIDPGIPNGGMPTNIAYVSPRFGFAYDLQGQGQTVIRGGWGEYAWNDQPPGGALQTSQNMQTYNSPGGQAITLQQIGLQSGSGNPQPAGSITADPYNDHAVANTYAWNLTVDRQMPWGSMLEVAYVANSTQHLLMGGQSDAVGIGGSGFTNINKIPVGGLFKPDPVTGAAAPTDPDNTGSYNLANYEPYSGCTASGACYGYGTNSITVQQHLGYSNYNGLQVAWMKQAGHASFNFNYTWSKSLGIVSSTLDAFSLHGNYGILGIDRPQVFNSSYAYGIGKVYHGSQLFLSGLANGWTLSGITTFQTGGNLQANSSQNLGLTIQEPSGSGNNTSGSTETLSTRTWFGTDQGSILPITTCNPKSGLSSHQLLNFSCFTAPAVGQQGNRVQHPYLSGPIYTDTDLSVFKNFNITERQTVEFRASAFNFVNHPLWGSTGGNLLSLKYDTPDGGHTYTSSSSLLGVPESGPCTTTGTAAWGCMNQKYPYSAAAYGRIVELSLKYDF
jgi:hypothetical protein